MGLSNRWLNPRRVTSGGTVSQTPSWRVAWGTPTGLPGIPTWQEGNAAFFLDEPPCFSPSQRYVVAGDLWLADSGKRSRLTPEPLPLTDLQHVANLWEVCGTQTLEKLVGVFALVVWDREQQTLWIARDRVGARTLYYTSTNGTCWIAPRLRSLAPHRSNDLDSVALRDYLCCAFVPGERTLWQQVRELRPGTVMRLPDRQITAYWQLREQISHAEQPLAWHGERLRSQLESVIRESLPTDEPVGVFLSGGLDSSAVTALAARLHSHPVHTFSIHFGEECPNELEFSSLVADHCRTQHHILEIPFRQMWDCLAETMALLDDPIGDPLTVPNLLVGRLARDYVQVTLNGEGGDPCFGGPKNQPMLINSLYGSVTHQSPLQAYLISFQKCAADLPLLLKPDIWRAVQAAPSVFEADLNSDASYLNRLMAINIQYKGADQILTKVNNLTRAAGLDGRSPLFDQRIVEMSMQIPPEYKLSGVEEKAVLKSAVADLLPEKILYRPKSGMMVPVQRGFRRYWNRDARSLLLNRQAAIAPYLSSEPIRQWLNYQGDPWNRYGVKLWLLTSLEIWLQVNR